jgi:hypothetical protein
LPIKLEGPSTTNQSGWGILYRARADEVSQARPVFTGDILAQGTLIVLQHPCALRVGGVNLAERLLVARVEGFPLIPLSRWVGNFRKMPLPELWPGRLEEHYAADFVNLDFIKSSDLELTERVACLSQVGVNLLMQRWVHHNSRVIVPSHDFQVVTSGPFEEAELTEEWCEERVLAGGDLATSMSEAHAWMRADGGDGVSRQKLLDDPQRRSRVRLEMRQHLRSQVA